MLTYQEIYDRLVTAATDGTFPSFNKNKVVCEYKSEDGKHKCAVGIFIPDSTYYPEIEGYRFASIRADIKNLFPNASLMAQIQDLHDRLAIDNATWNSKEFINILNDIFSSYGIIVNTINP